MSMSRGYVSTSAADGRPLLIYYIHEAPDQGTLSAEIRVLEEFAEAWTRGELHVDGKAPFADARPCDVIVVAGSHHVSTNTPTEAKHLTVSPASESSWATGYARSGVHVYSVNDDVAMGYRGWRKTTSSKHRFQGVTIKRHLKEAMSNNLASQGQAGESSETPAGYYDDGTPYFWSGSSQTYYYYGQDGKRQRAG